MWSCLLLLTSCLAEVGPLRVTFDLSDKSLDGLKASDRARYEETILPRDALGWAAVLGLGLGPVGLAFFVWDIGVKRGDIQLLGTSSYAAPLLSTLVLVLAGVAAPSMTLLWAAVLITGGAFLAARASLQTVRSG